MVVCLCCNILFDEHRTATVVRVVVDRPLQGTISSKYFYEEKYIHLYYYNIYIYKQTISNWYIMKRKFKHWWSLIPPMSTKRTITAYPHWTLLHTKKTTSYMTLKIQVPLAWDGHKKVAELHRIMGSLYWKKHIYVTVYKCVQIPKFTPAFLVGLCCSIHNFLCNVLWIMFVFLFFFLWSLYCLSFVHWIPCTTIHKEKS